MATDGKNGQAAGKVTEFVNLSIDGKPARVPKGTNLIEAAKSIGIDIPYYCYHPHLSIAGNCRMCQVRVKGAPKLDIACNTIVREGMEVLTQHTAPEVADAQAATLEFILINHPLDCTVCDQAGHCKLQDYHFEYNARPSRFLENKEHKVKAEPLGPTVMLDGERCIMCSRCVRFCDEVTGTSEIGLINRGDKTVIAVNKERELRNPLSGTVVDLCPVGALTHREWRFNTRIWFTKETDSICPGCSTGCNVKVAERDGCIVQVKARLNSEVNKEWLCDEGRYGFERFLPSERVTAPHVDGKPSSWEAALREARKVTAGESLVFVSPDLTLEEYGALKQFLNSYAGKHQIALAYRERNLSPQEAVLVSPDYACNFKGAQFAGLVSGDLEGQYEAALKKLSDGGVSGVLLIGERAILSEDLEPPVIEALRRVAISVSVHTDAASARNSVCRVVLPGRSILEKSGLLVNRNERLQFAQAVIAAPHGSESEWQVINRLASECGGKVVSVSSERELTRAFLAADTRLTGLDIATIKQGGVCLRSRLGRGESSAGTETTAGREVSV